MPEPNAAAPVPGDPPRDCALCPRLVALRAQTARQTPDGWNAPVPSFGAASARLMVLGLAPGLTGAHRTGRAFTGDGSGQILFDTLVATGFASGQYSGTPNDGIALHDCLITNALRCLPPQNKPTAAEVATCRPFLDQLIAGMPDLAVILCLGRIAHEALIRGAGLRLADHPFAHGARHCLPLPDGRRLTVIDSYHCSRYNVNTKRLTPDMLHAVFRQAWHAIPGLSTRA